MIFELNARTPVDSFFQRPISVTKRPLIFSGTTTALLLLEIAVITAEPSETSYV